jgi:pyridine nucleotide-disulfide oxidoreductase family protein
VKRLVLIGAGHAHVQVLHHWIAAPLPNVELVLVSPSRLAPYSGMVPGWLQGVYGFDEISIDAAALANAAGARFIEDEVTAIEPGEQWLRLRHHEAVRYDVAALNIGSTLYPPPGMRGQLLSMRPLGDLCASWDALLAGLDPREQGSRRLIAAGAGPAGVESLLAVMARLRRVQPRMRVEGLLVTKDPHILPTHASTVRRAVDHALRSAGASVMTRVDAASIETRDTDIVLWATGAQAHRWPADSGLGVDAQGFVRIDNTLRSPLDPTVFAAGDCAAWPTPLPKAGVIPVRQGPVLSHNLRAALTGGAMSTYAPQRRHLALLSTGDGRAIASWGPWSASGRWVWRWKDRIDRKFVRRFSSP